MHRRSGSDRIFTLEHLGAHLFLGRMLSGRVQTPGDCIGRGAGPSRLGHHQEIVGSLDHSHTQAQGKPRSKTWPLLPKDLD